MLTPNDRPLSNGAKPIRLLIVNAVGPGYNGQMAFIMKYLRSMDRTGMKIGFVSIRMPPEPLRAELESLGVQVYALQRKRKPLSYVRNLSRIIRREGYTIVHAHGNSATLALEMAAARLGGAHARIAHSHNTHCRYAAAHYLLKPIFSRLTNVRMACGEAAGRWMFGRAPFEIIPIAADPEAYRFDQAKRDAMRRALGVPEEYTLIGCVALFTAVKNHGFLLEAFALARRSAPQLRLVLIGDGPLRAQIESDIRRLNLSDAVMLTGAVTDVPERMQALDMLVLPSLYEGFPNVLVEAQMSGLPILVSDQVTRDCDMTGLLTYLPLQADVWAEKMACAVPVNRSITSEKGCSAAAAHGYDVRKEAAKLRARYEELERN